MSNQKVILLVEDEAIIALREQQILQKHGYIVHIASTGEKAIEEIQSDTHFDLVLMDIDLGKGMDGTEAAEHILQQKDLPLIFLSSHTEPEIVDRTEGISSYGYVVKNTGETVLTAAIKMAFKLFKSNQAVAVEKNHYKSYLENSLEGCQILDHDWKYLFLNNVAQKHNKRPNEELIGKRYQEMWPGITETHVYSVIKDTLKNRVPHKLENFFAYPDGSTGWFLLNIRPVDEGVFISSLDITESKQAQEEREIVVEFLQLVNESIVLDDLIKRAVLFFKDKSGMEAVGLRLKSNDDFPYIETAGFSDEFVKHENQLCQQHREGIDLPHEEGEPFLECMCGNILQGRVNKSQSFITDSGSFWVNNFSITSAEPAKEDSRSKSRNYCRRMGYESVGLFPLKNGENRIGLLQLNDTRKNCFNTSKVALWERLAGYLAVALSKFQTEMLLEHTEQKATLYKDQYEKFFNVAPGLVCIASTTDGKLKEINDAWTLTLGYSKQELMEKPFIEFIHPDDREKTEAKFAELLEGNDALHFMNRYRTKNGNYRYLDWMTSKAVDNKLFAVATDITDMVQARKQQDELIKEKQTLFSELQHRIKNSFSMIQSLLAMSEVPEGSGFNLILDDLHTRVSAIAEMYSLLYQDEQLQSIRLDQYLEKIVTLVTKSYSNISLDSQFDTIQCSTDYAIPVGIITAELLTNAAKYAYNPIDEKFIQFRLLIENQRINITVADRGKGIPRTLDVRNSPTMGFKLVYALKEQIHGTLTLDSTRGTKWTLEFFLKE